MLLLLQARDGAGMLSRRHAVHRPFLKQVHLERIKLSSVHAQLDVLERSPVLHVARMTLRGWGGKIARGA
jgi:hypothetical protein